MRSTEAWWSIEHIKPMRIGDQNEVKVVLVVPTGEAHVG